VRALDFEIIISEIKTHREREREREDISGCAPSTGKRKDNSRPDYWPTSGKDKKSCVLQKRNLRRKKNSCVPAESETRGRKRRVPLLARVSLPFSF